MLDLQGILRMDLAEVYLLSGDLEKRAASLVDALGFFEPRGNLVNAERARAALAGT
jgi:hypothetical protein